MIIHIDMDYFFAQAEEERQPFFKGRVVIVCVYSGRAQDAGVVSTVNYEGRKYGVHSGMPIFQAKKRAPPNAVFLPVDRVYYEELSAKIDETVRKYSAKVEKTSIDEWFLEVSRIPEETAAALKQEIKERTGLTCTIGVAPSKLGAKMAAAKAKPNGLLVLDKQEEREFIEDSSVEKIPGIGQKTTGALNSIGIRYVKDIQKTDSVKIVEVFGKKIGAWICNLGRGEYLEKIEEEVEQSEVSKIGTLKELTRDQYILLLKIKELEKELFPWLMERKKSYNTVTIVFITEDMKTHSKSLTFRKPKSWNDDITDEIKILVDDFINAVGYSVRRVGIKFSNLVDITGQTTLF